MIEGINAGIKVFKVMSYLYRNQSFMPPWLIHNGIPRLDTSCSLWENTLQLEWSGRLAQLVRALARQARGHRFESRIAQWRKALKYKCLRHLWFFSFGYCGCRITAVAAVINEKGTHMPILKNRPPKYQRSGKYAVICHHGKRHFLRLYGPPESQVAYSRFVAESQANPVFYLSKGETNITVRELATAFLDHANGKHAKRLRRKPGDFLKFKTLWRLEYR